MTPSLRLLKMQSIKSPFYKHPPLAELRRAKTPQNTSLHSIRSGKNKRDTNAYEDMELGGSEFDDS